MSKTEPRMVRRVWVAATLSIALLGAMAPAAIAVTGPRDKQSLDRFGGAGSGGGGAATADAVPGEVLVKYHPQVARSDRLEARYDVQADLVRRLDLPRVELLEVGDREVEDAIGALENDPDVVYAEPNYIYESSAADIPNDTDFTELWGLHSTGQPINGTPGAPDADIDAPEAWATHTGSKSIVVAVADTGIVYDHPDIAPNMWANPGESGGGKETNETDDDGNGYADDLRGWDFVDEDNDPYDFHSHGTHVAGTIGAKGDNAAGITGVNWDVSLMALRVLGTTGAGTNAEIAEAFDYAGDNGADVLNASLGGGGFSSTMSNAITSHPDTLYVVAAGNDGSNNDLTPTYPCNYTAANLVCVASTTSTDARSDFSNFGGSSVDLGAPGSAILSTVPPDRFTSISEGFQDGEGWASRWTMGGTNNSWSRAADEFGFSLLDSPSGNYLANTNSWVQTSAPVDLSEREGCTLSYWHKIDTQPNVDIFRIEASTNGTSWTALHAWSGSFGWRFRNTDLKIFEGAPQLHLRFRLSTDATDQRNGVSLDDIELSCATRGGFVGDEYAHFNGTSMASPHVAGAVALLIAAVPGATTTEVRDALLDGVDPKASMMGITVTGGRLNLKGSLDLLAAESPPDTPPPDTPPTDVSVGGFAQPFVRTKSFALNLRATDPDGIDTYTLRQRIAGFNASFRPFETKDSTSGKITFNRFPLGATGCFSAAATDNLGATSGFSVERCTSLPLNNTQLDHKGQWAKKKASGHFMKSYSTTKKKGATLALPGVKAKRFALLATKCKGCGTVKVSLGKSLLKRINLSATGTKKNQLITLKTLGTVKSGTVKITVVSKNKKVMVEGLAASKR